jgi:hypothetical protein
MTGHDWAGHARLLVFLGGTGALIALKFKSARAAAMNDGENGHPDRILLIKNDMAFMFVSSDSYSESLILAPHIGIFRQ